jgi:integrase
MAKVRLIGRPQPANRERVGIDVLVGQGQRRWFFSTGVVVESGQWDPIRRLVKGSGKDASWANSKAGQALETVRARVRQLELNGQPLTRALVSDGLGGTRHHLPKLGAALLAHLDYLRQMRKATTVEDYATTARDLQDYLSPQHEVADLTRERLEGWVQQLHRMGNTNLTVKKKLGNVRAFCRWAVEKGWLAAVPSTVVLGRSYAVQPENTAYLDQGEVDRLRDCPLSPQLSRARDVLLFLCYTGLRYGDYIGLEPELERRGQSFDPSTGATRRYVYLRLEAAKTPGELIEVVLHPSALEIWRRYQGRLPKITPQPLNRAIKRAAQAAGLASPWQIVRYRGTERLVEVVPKYAALTTHSGRHTFITLMEQRGVPLTDIQRIVGHRKVQTTARYTRSTRERRAGHVLDAWANLRGGQKTEQPPGR